VSRNTAIYRPKLTSPLASTASLVAPVVAPGVGYGVATRISKLLAASGSGGAEDVGVTALADLSRTPALAVLPHETLALALLVTQVAVRCRKNRGYQFSFFSPL